MRVGSRTKKRSFQPRMTTYARLLSIPCEGSDEAGGGDGGHKEVMVGKDGTKLTAKQIANQKRNARREKKKLLMGGEGDDK